jgi:sialidase-1
MHLNILVSILLTIQTGIYHREGGGLRNSQIRFERDKVGTVAFLGGSITQNGGWRDSICNFLQERFPDTRFTFIPAGIASMGSTPGAFRLERDVLSKGPIDLLFEEAAVNDATNGRNQEEQIRGMEGIIRHTLKANPATDIVVMHFVDPGKMETYSQGKIPEVIRNFDEVADHYKVGTVNLAKEVTDRINNGEFTWEDDFKDVHPSPFGQSIYFRSMKAFLEQSYAQAVTGNEQITPHPIPEPLDPYCYDHGSIVHFQKAIDVQGFEHINNWSPDLIAGTRKGYTNVDMLVGVHAGDGFTFPFEGNAVGIMVAAGPDAGVIEYSIDGKDVRTLDLFTRWSQQLYLPWYYTLASGLEQGKHTLVVKISRDKNAESLGHSCILKAFYINK